MDGKRQRKYYFIEPELQFWFIIVLIIAVSVEGIFVGYGISRLFSISSQWHTPGMPMSFFKTLVLVLVFIIGANFIIGTYLSHKIAGPIFRLKSELLQIQEGELCNIVQLRPGDLLKDTLAKFNETVQVLNKLIDQDRDLVKRSLAHIDQCQQIISTRPTESGIEEIQEKFLNIKSCLVMINSHFKSNDNAGLKEENLGK